MAASGVLVLSGDDDRPPLRISVPHAYLHACADAAGAALIAYYDRLNTGLGQHVDVAAQQSVSLAAQSTLLAAPLSADETRRMAGGVSSAPSACRWFGRRRTASSPASFCSAALGVFTRKMMNYIYDHGFCDQATRDKD